MSLTFLSLSSGSSGNCYYLGTADWAVLIDAGIPVRVIQRTLRGAGLRFDLLRAVLITHDHTDHIRSAGTLGELYHLPVYATRAVHQGMERNYGMQKKLSTASRRYLEVGVEHDIPGTGLRVTPFTVPHDSTDNVGYYIEYGDVRFCIATDVGCPTDAIRSHLRRADHIVVESNHDVQMLMDGPYPPYLKARVRGEGGHMSNDECADVLRSVYHAGMRHIFLCHLSHENNRPALAHATARDALASLGVAVGRDVVLDVLRRGAPSRVYTLSGVAAPSPTPPTGQLELTFNT